MNKKLWLITPGIALLVAGIAHALSAPARFDNLPAYGLYFATIGVLQIAWAMMWLIMLMWLIVTRRADGRPPLALFWVGVALSGGNLILWMLGQGITAPFTDVPESLDALGLTTKLAEMIAFAALALDGERRAKRLPKSVKRWTRPTTPKAMLVSLGVGLLIWGTASASQPIFPELEGVASHNVGVLPTVMAQRTIAYMSIVNSGAEPETLVGVSLDRGTAHLEADAVDLPRHTRVAFNESNNRLLLEDLPGDLYEGDSVTLTLVFASGKAVTLDFEAALSAPDAGINFTVIDGFQITDAWVQATADEFGAVTVSVDGYDWELPPGFPVPRVPANNPMTAEKVELGRFLFYDTRLSGNGTAACASCHFQELAFTDGRALAIGATGDVHPRNSMSLTNSAYSATLNWAHPTLVDLEEQALTPMFGEQPVEMGITGNEDVVLDRFRTDADYRAMFAAAFPEQDDPFTFDNIRKALSSFTRTLISGTSSYDQYLRGDTDALSESAIRGMALFFSEKFECHHCHTGFNFTLSTATANTTFEERPFFNTGLYNIDGEGAYPPGNTGIYDITNDPRDMGRFRPPTLRNVELTAPYMHDGSIATLEDVIDFYAAGGRDITEGVYAGDGRANPFKSGFVPGFPITDQERADLIAFLQSLTDEGFLTDPRFSDPFAGVGG